MQMLCFSVDVLQVCSRMPMRADLKSHGRLFNVDSDFGPNTRWAPFNVCGLQGRMLAYWGLQGFRFQVCEAFAALKWLTTKG